MANTIVKIKRTAVSGRAANTTTLTNPGELALNMTDGIMYSTNGSVVFEVGANNTNVNITGNATIGAVIANGSIGTATQVLSSNGTGIYWASPSAGSIGGANTQVQFNDSSTSNGSADFTFNKSTNTITIGSSSNTFNTFFGNSIFHGYAKTDLQNKFVDFGVESSNTLGNFGSYFYLNGTNPQMWASAFPSDGSQMYIDFYVVGANQTIGSATLESVYYKQFGVNEKNILNRFISNSTTSYYESSYSNTADGVYNSVVTVTNSSVSSITLGNSSVNTVVNSTTFSGTANNSTNLNGQSASYYTNASNINTGTLPYAQIPANIINTTAAFTISGIHTYSANIILGSSGLSANGSFGTAGHVLHSNGTATYWAADDVGGTVAGSNTQLQFNDSGVANATAGFTFDKTSNTISVGNSTVNTTANSASFLPGLMYHNYQNINIDYTIANNYSASMVGPVTIAAGKTLTVNSGARFVVI